MIHLSFDIEEFDTPLEYGKQIPESRQMQISISGTKAILSILNDKDIKGTFFITANFALKNQELVLQILNDGHEIGSHSFYHSYLEIPHLKSSREVLEKICKIPIIGFRMPRMKKISSEDILNAGYIYDSSLNPCYLPGRYNNLDKSRTIHKEGELIIAPSSVTPVIRFPLFWLSFHNIPLWLFSLMSRLTLKADGYLNIYFHPWEFAKISDSTLGLPFYITKNSGDKMIRRLSHFIDKMKKGGHHFCPLVQNPTIESLRKFKSNS